MSPSQSGPAAAADDTAAGSRESRRRNARGDGAQLADELVEAAGRLLEQLPSEEALSLRAVAREAGVSAPSIYLHFPDKSALVLEVLRRRFGELAAHLDAAGSGPETPDRQLLARCRAYCTFAGEHPGAYHVMFSSVPVERTEAPDLPGQDMIAANAALLARCGVAEPFEAAALLWAGLHGIVTLRRTKPLFPWPDLDLSVRRLLESLLPATRS